MPWRIPFLTSSVTKTPACQMGVSFHHYLTSNLMVWNYYREIFFSQIWVHNSLISCTYFCCFCCCWYSTRIEGGVSWDVGQIGTRACKKTMCLSWFVILCNVTNSASVVPIWKAMIVLSYLCCLVPCASLLYPIYIM
jgi:hypothetical protein